jgi:hypothetical protein
MKASQATARTNLSARLDGGREEGISRYFAPFHPLSQADDRSGGPLHPALAGSFHSLLGFRPFRRRSGLPAGSRCPCSDDHIQCPLYRPSSDVR